jgi:hypothetical protein
LLPSPCCRPWLHSPSYASPGARADVRHGRGARLGPGEGAAPSGKTCRPFPWKRPFTKLPSYTSPSGYVICRAGRVVEGNREARPVIRAAAPHGNCRPGAAVGGRQRYGGQWVEPCGTLPGFLCPSWISGRHQRRHLAFSAGRLWNSGHWIPAGLQHDDAHRAHWIFGGAAADDAVGLQRGSTPC